ncbi:MAG: DNA-binding protein [Thermoplasmata archaeon]|nr:DNA-binding protein [Thermoplasmata archaeon]
MAENDEELEAIRRRKLGEIKQQQDQQQMVEDQESQMKAQRQAVMRRILTPEARERLGRLALAHPGIVDNVENQLMLLAQTGRIKGVIDDATLVEILGRIIPKKRDIKIERR